MTLGAKLEERSNTTRMMFIQLELELAETYCNLAIQTTYNDKYDCYISNAQRAFDMASRSLHLVRMTDRENESFLAKLADMRKMLELLKQGLAPPAVALAP